MILGYTLTTFPKSRKTLMHNQSNRDFWHNCKRNKRNNDTNKQLHLNASRRTLQLQAEHGIKSLSGLLVKHLSQVWSWHSCLPYSMLCYNGYSTPNLNGYSPYELVFGHRMTLSQELELKVDTTSKWNFY